jgi:Ca2+-binding RTX toxin-like protein
MGSDNIDGVGNADSNNITGNSANNVLSGDAGNDALVGGAGNDTLDGGAGADKMTGGTGDDVYIVDNTNDVVTEKANEGTDTIETTLTSLNIAKLSAIENLTYTGLSNATLLGNASVNTLTGNSGADRLDGGIGGDSLIGGDGNDLYIVDDLNDTITENDNEGTDSVQSSVAFTLSNYVENLTLTGKAAINGTGSDQNNTITGNTAANTLNGGLGNDTLDGGAGNDVLIGGDGADILIGGLGNDSLTGGDGADIFKFNTALGKTNIDTVTDFTHVTDQLQLDDAIFKKFIGSSGQVSAGNFVSGGNGVKALDANDYLIFNSATGALFYDADGSGKGAAIQFVTVVGVADVTASDIWIV